MSMLNSVSDFSSAHTIRRSIGGFARSVLRLVNTVVAAVIAQRERQATFAILRSMTDRELRDVGISRNQIGPGIALAARERAQAQRALTRRP